MCSKVKIGEVQLELRYVEDGRFCGGHFVLVCCLVQKASHTMVFLIHVRGMFECVLLFYTRGIYWLYKTSNEL